MVGLGAIGVRVANAAKGIGMRVIGFDPHMTVEGAWQLSSDVDKAVLPPANLVFLVDVSGSMEMPITWAVAVFRRRILPSPSSMSTPSI